MLQFGGSLTDDTSNVNYDHNMFIIQATVVLKGAMTLSIITFSITTLRVTIKNVTLI
jgi:hypothetical protein